MININTNSLKNLPDHKGRFGEFGGRFVAETLMPLILSVEESFTRYLPKLNAVPEVSPSGVALPNSEMISETEICPVGVVML